MDKIGKLKNSQERTFFFFLFVKTILIVKNAYVNAKEIKFLDFYTIPFPEFVNKCIGNAIFLV